MGVAGEATSFDPLLVVGDLFPPFFPAAFTFGAFAPGVTGTAGTTATGSDTGTVTGTAATGTAIGAAIGADTGMAVDFGKGRKKLVHEEFNSKHK